MCSFTWHNLCFLLQQVSKWVVQQQQLWNLCWPHARPPFRLRGVSFPTAVISHCNVQASSRTLSWIGGARMIVQVSFALEPALRIFRLKTHHTWMVPSRGFQWTHGYSHSEFITATTCETVNKVWRKTLCSFFFQLKKWYKSRLSVKWLVKRGLGNSWVITLGIKFPQMEYHDPLSKILLFMSLLHWAKARASCLSCLLGTVAVETKLWSEHPEALHRARIMLFIVEEWLFLSCSPPTRSQISRGRLRTAYVVVVVRRRQHSKRPCALQTSVTIGPWGTLSAAQAVPAFPGRSYARATVWQKSSLEGTSPSKRVTDIPCAAAGSQIQPSSWCLQAGGERAETGWGWAGPSLPWAAGKEPAEGRTRDCLCWAALLQQLRWHWDVPPATEPVVTMEERQPSRHQLNNVVFLATIELWCNNLIHSLSKVDESNIFCYCALKWNKTLLAGASQISPFMNFDWFPWKHWHTPFSTGVRAWTKELLNEAAASSCPYAWQRAAFSGNISD